MALNVAAAVISLPHDVDAQLEEFRRLLGQLQASVEALARANPQGAQALEPALLRAQLCLALSRAVHALHHLHQRCHGRDPMATASANKELLRLKQYGRKVARSVEQEELRTSRPSLTLDVAAANRFINAAVPSLTAEQRSQLKAQAARGHVMGDTTQPGAKRARAAGDANSWEPEGHQGHARGKPHGRAAPGGKGPKGSNRVLVDAAQAAKTFLSALTAAQQKQQSGQ